MKEIIDFIIKHWSYISVAILAIIEVIIFAIKKRPVKVVDSVKGFISRVLPELISLAEEQYPAGGHGVEKFNMVLSLLSDLLSQNGYSMTDTLDKYARQQIENILSTPQKKGE